MVLVRREGEFRAEGVVAATDRGGAAFRYCGSVVELQFGVAAAHHAAAQRHAQLIGHDGAAQVEVRLVGVARLAVLLQQRLHTHGAAPFLGYLAGNDVDHPAHGVGAVEGGHRAADHLDALDRGHGGNEAGGGVTEAVGRDVARNVLATAVDKNQRVVAGHAADADVQVAGLAGGTAYVYALYVPQCVGQVGKGFLFQFLARDDGDRSGRGLDVLLEAGCCHYDGIELLDRLLRGNRCSDQ